MGSWKGRGNQYIEFARVLYCKLPTNGKQLPAFPHKALKGIEPRPQRWEVRVLPLCHHGPPIQELNIDFAKICITPKPSGAPIAKVPLPVLKELEHQARQNISTLNFTTAFAKTSSSCNASLDEQSI